MTDPEYYAIIEVEMLEVDIANDWQGRSIMDKTFGSRSMRSWSLEVEREGEEVAIIFYSLDVGGFQEWVSV